MRTCGEDRPEWLPMTGGAPPELAADGSPEVQLEAYEYSVTDRGNGCSGAPHGYHDDCVIALALDAWSLKMGDRTFVIGAAPEVF